MDGWHDVEDMVLLWMGVQLNGGLLGGNGWRIQFLSDPG